MRPAIELAELVRSGELTAAELVQASLDRIDALQPTVNAFTHVAHESACSTPSVRYARVGATRAHRPKAPSTCTNAPCSRAIRPSVLTSSQAPEFTLPTCRQTTVGPLILGNASTRMRP